MSSEYVGKVRLYDWLVSGYSSDGDAVSSTTVGDDDSDDAPDQNTVLVLLRLIALICLLVGAVAVEC